MKLFVWIVFVLLLGTGCHLFLPSGTPPSPNKNITNTVKALPPIMSLQQAQLEMRRRIFMNWAFKHNPPPMVRLVEDMTNSTYQQLARRLYYAMVVDDEIKIGTPMNAFVMHQTFAFGVNAYENNENVLIWETIIYPPQATRDDAILSLKQTRHGIAPKPIWRSLPIHIKWDEIETQFKTTLGVKPDTSYIIIRPIGTQL